MEKLLLDIDEVIAAYQSINNEGKRLSDRLRTTLQGSVPDFITVDVEWQFYHQRFEVTFNFEEGKTIGYLNIGEYDPFILRNQMLQEVQTILAKQFSDELNQMIQNKLDKRH